MRQKLIIGILMLSTLSPYYGHAGSVSDEKGFARYGRLEEYDKAAKGANSAGINQRGYYRDPEYRHEVKAGMSQDEWEAKQEARAKQRQWEYEHREELEKKAQERRLREAEERAKQAEDRRQHEEAHRQWLEREARLHQEELQRELQRKQEEERLRLEKEKREYEEEFQRQWKKARWILLGATLTLLGLWFYDKKYR